MKILKQKYHGLPGLGINGKIGEQGVKAESIYMGYINDFFDGEDISVGTLIYAAKRTFNHPNASTLDASTIEAAWAVTQQELNVFHTPNTILKSAVENSSNSSTSYINFKTFYYTGTRLTDDKIVDGIFSGNSSTSATSDTSLAKFVELDLTGDFISMSFMLKTVDESENNLDFKQYKSEYDTKLSNMDTHDFSQQGHEIYNEYNITDEKTYRKFDDSAIIYGKFYDDQNDRYLIYLPYDTNDAIYKSSSVAGIAAEDGSLLLNEQYRNYYENHGEFNYVKEYIPNNNDLLLTDVNTHYAKLDSSKLETSIFYGDNNISFLINGVETGDKAYWNEFYKTSFTTKILSKSTLIPNYSLYQDDDLLDSENNAFYGVASPVLFNNKGDSSISINNEGINKISSLITDPDYIQRIIDGKNNVNILLNDKNGLNIFYSLNDTESSLFVPSTLSSYYKPGDVLYFYADSYAFNNISDQNYKNIMYMVVLTEDLMGCTPLQLMSAAQLISPLEIKNFSFNNNNRVCNYNNIAVLLNDISVSNNTKKLALSNKSYIGIADNYTDAPVILAAKDGSIFNNFVAVDSSVALNGNVSNNLFNIDVSDNIPIKLNNLNVVSNNITEETNVELYNHIYDSNIKFDNEKFIKPLLDLDLYYDTNNTALLSQTLNGADYFYDIENLYGYFYGCDIYNSDMKKIQTITSIDKTLTIDLIPDVNNTVYYFQIFASCSNSLKYYSKLTQLTLTYKLNKYYGEEKEIKILDRTYYSSPIGQFSTVIKKKKMPKRRTVTERYEIDKIKIELLGLDQHIVKEQKFGNIFFDLTDINAEKVDASLFVYTEDPSIIIDDILFNHKHCDENININNWSKISSIADFTDASVFNIDLSSNLPAFNNSTGICENIQEYIILGSEHIEENSNNSESKLFNLLSNSNYVKPASMQRSILVTAKYHYKDRPYEYYYENYNIVQPGFKDTRDVPVFELNTHTLIHELESYNSIDNGVLNNQFVTYIDINIKDFKKQWGQFIVDPSIKISMDVSIANIDYDLNWQYNYIVEQLTSRRTFKVILEDIDSSVTKLNNYVKLTTSLFETSDNLLTKNTNNCNSINGSLNCGGSYNIDSSFILYNTPDNTKGIKPLIVDNYILCDKQFIDIHKNSNLMYNGLQNNIMIGLSDIPISDDIDTIKLKLSLEMGNPMLANMYFRFVIKHINIKVNIGDSNKPIIFTTFVPNTFNIDTKNTYLADISTDVNTSRKINRVNYKYISNPIDITFNPLSYTVCPNDAETTYTNIYGSLDKYGIKDQIKKELKFFNSSVYEHNPYNYTGKQIREHSYYPFNNLYIKKSYIQDNVKTINVKPVSLWDVIQKTNLTTLSSSINEELKHHNVLDFIEGNKYLSIVYNSVIMSPRIRNDKYCFYYNDNLYPRAKYDQKVNNMPVFAYDTQSIELRDDILINSMDKWNDYYTEHKTFDSEKAYHGVLSLYGNGYTQIVDDISTDIFNEYVMDLKEVKNQNDVSINLYSGINEVDINPMKQDQPNNKEYFRGFLYDINWEFPYYDNKNEIIPYRIVSPFDNFLNNTSTNIQEIYQDYYNALTDLTDASYGTNMIPSNLLFDINPRIAYNYENSGVNVLMLRRPSIGIDTDNIDTSTDFKEKYEFNNQLFDLVSAIEKLSSPYIIKSNE